MDNISLLKGICKYVNFVPKGSNGNVGLLDCEGDDIKSVIRQCFNTFAMNGFSRNQIIGILCNIYQESRFNFKAVNNIGAEGLCQWLGQRKLNFEHKYGKRIINSSPIEQIEFAISELKSNSKYYHYNELLSSSSVKDACYIWLRYFERPGNYNTELNKRLSFKSIIEQYLS